MCFSLLSVQYTGGVDLPKPVFPTVTILGSLEMQAPWPPGPGKHGALLCDFMHMLALAGQLEYSRWGTLAGFRKAAENVLTVCTQGLPWCCRRVLCLCIHAGTKMWVAECGDCLHSPAPDRMQGTVAMFVLTDFSKGAGECHDCLCLPIPARKWGNHCNYPCSLALARHSTVPHHSASPIPGSKWEVL